MEGFGVGKSANERTKIAAIRRGAIQLVGFVTLGLGATSVFGYGNDMSGSCINDAGRGAMLWGTSSEVTTYSEPYAPFKTPEIYRIPLTSEQASQPPESANDYQGTLGNAFERLTESGTIFGADGKLYEYTYRRGVEPRRIIETRRVQDRMGVWKEEKIEHIEWRPVLIRVLRPAGTNAKLESQAAALRNAIATPAPCESVGPAEPKTFANQTDGGAAQSASPAATQAPPVEGSSPVVAARREEASVRVSTPAAAVGPRNPRTVLTLPEEVRRNAQKAAEEQKNAQTKRSIFQRPSAVQNQGQTSRK